MATPIDIIMATPQEPTNQEEATSTPGEGSAPTPPTSDAANASLTTSAAAASGAVATATPSSSTPNQPDVIDTSKLKSEVWEHMTKKMIGGKMRAECKYCKNNYAASANSDTRHLRSHIESCLRKKQQKFPQAFQKLLVTKKSEGKTTLSNYEFDQGVCRKDLVQMVVLHEHPLSLVDQIGFKIFCNSMQPLFKIPTRNTVRSDVLKLYKDRTKRVMWQLENNEGRVAITTDMWTADNQKKSYMAVTAHFVDDSWHLQQRLLRFQYVPSPHTIDVLVEHLMNVLLDWNLDSRLSTITVDNCNTNDGVVEALVNKLENEQLLLCGSFLHMRCCAHILNLIVKDGLDVIGPSLEKNCASCVYWSSTPKKIEKFEETARQCKISCTKKLCYDVKTRWNSTYNMLEIALTYKDVFHRLKIRDKQYKTVPSDEDWENARIISAKLKIFYTTTELFSGTKYTTANLYFSNICEIRLALRNWMLDSNLTIAIMASRMNEKYEKYWGNIHSIMGVATLLDPRSKTVLITYYYKKIYGNNYESEVEKVLDLCRRLFREYQRRYSNQHVEEPTIVSAKKQKLGFPNNYNMFAETMKKDYNMTTELELYLEEGLVPTDDDNFEVLEWWKSSNGSKFRTLRNIARDIYTIPVSTVASESAFSMGGRIISPQRNRLHPQLVEALACAQNWLRADFEDLGEGNPFKTYYDDLDHY